MAQKQWPLIELRIVQVSPEGTSTRVFTKQEIFALAVLATLIPPIKPARCISTCEVEHSAAILSSCPCELEEILRRKGYVFFSTS